MAVMVKTPARLHLGLLDMNGELGRLYGSIGVAIERPNVVVEAEPATELCIEGPDSQRAETFARRFLNRHPRAKGAYLRIEQVIPAHVGLGSGTQLALAVGTALARLYDLDISLVELARVMGRGIHSGIGIAAFEWGGFVVDGGHPVGGGSGMVPPVTFRHPFPRDWAFVVAVPVTKKGFSGEEERQAFSELPPVPSTVVERICRLLVVKMLPSLLEKDIVGFGHALTEIQRLVGDGFAAVQGGRFAHPLSAELIAYLLDRGARGAGQSSWGPAVYGLVEGEEALALKGGIESWLEKRGGGVVFHVHATNQGAGIEFRWDDKERRVGVM
jgi:beta-ribofuranosylaminobenzene 5'-phosphate synthase